MFFMLFVILFILVQNFVTYLQRGVYSSAENIFKMLFLNILIKPIWSGYTLAYSL